MRFLIICFLSLFMLNCTSNKEQQNLIDNFFSTYEKKGQTEAFKYVYSTNKWMESTSTIQNDSLVNQLTRLTEQLGKYEGFELLRSEQISKSLEIQSYLVKYERQPLRFNFILYQSYGAWRFQQFQFDSNVTTEMQLITDISWYH